MKSAKEFSVVLEEVSAFCEDNIEDVINKTILDLYASIVEKTPVKTGRAKGNWSVRLEYAEDVRNIDNVGDMQAAVNTEIRNFTWSIEDSAVYIFNNLPYIEALENGHSKQAPQGMVRVSLEEFTHALNANLAKLSGGLVKQK